MKILEKEFVSNVDHCGSHKFVQVKRDKDVAVYCRYKMDNSIFGYEIFKIKVVKEGSPLPGGIFVKEDYEVYPSKNAFGKTAMFVTARQVYNTDKLLEMFYKRHKEPGEESVKDTSAFVLPKGKFTVKMLMTQNPIKNYNDCYLYLRTQLNKTIKQVEVETESKGKGKPSNYYVQI